MGGADADLISSAPKPEAASGYGWTSIALHWISAIVILALLFSGDSISVSGPGAYAVHTSIGVCAWLLLAGRIWWRLWRGHPQRDARQGRYSFTAGLVVHYLLLAGLGLMLASGPVMGWANGRGLEAVVFSLPGAETPAPSIFSVALTVHHIGAWTIGLGTLAHIMGVLKHVMIDRDNTFERMMVARSGDRSEAKT